MSCNLPSKSPAIEIVGDRQMVQRGIRSYDNAGLVSGFVIMFNLLAYLDRDPQAAEETRNLPARHLLI